MVSQTDEREGISMNQFLLLQLDAWIHPAIELSLVLVCIWRILAFKQLSMEVESLVGVARLIFKDGNLGSLIAPNFSGIRSKSGKRLLDILKTIKVNRSRIDEQESSFESTEIIDSLSKLGSQIIATVDSQMPIKAKQVAVFRKTAKEIELIANRSAMLPRLQQVIKSTVVDIPSECPLSEIEDGSQDCLASMGFVRQLILHFDLGLANSYLAVWMGFDQVTQTSLRDEKWAIQQIIKRTNVLLQQVQKIEKLECALRTERAEFIGVSHDLKAPGITGLYIVRELQSQKCLDDLFQDRLLELEVLLLEQLSLTQDFLDLEKKNDVSFRIDPKEVLLKKLFKELSASPVVKYYNSTIKLKVTAPIEIAVKFDNMHIKRILNNLLSNAYKFSEKGEIELSLVQKRDHLEIHVIDNGRGVPEELRSQLFEDYCESNSTYNVYGNGIGLFASRLLAIQNGAELKFSPRQTGGSDFFLVIPNNLILNREHRTGGKVVKPDTSSPILIVEDDDATCRLYKRILSTNGIQSVSESSLHCAVERLRKGEEFSALVSDFKLIDGNCLYLLKEASRLGKNIPTLIISGVSEWCPRMEDELSELRKQFSIRFMEKPVEHSEFEQEIFDLLSSGVAVPEGGIVRTRQAYL